MPNKFYITTAIPYVNARPHIGHALEFAQADVIARWHRQQGNDTLLLSGADENALKNVQAAEKAGVSVRQFIKENRQFFTALAKKLNVQFDIFQKGSSKEHHASSQKLWKLCDKAGDIYQKAYQGLYCVGCETFYTPDELDPKGECFEHPGRKLERVREENYFFKLSKYQGELVRLIERDELRIIPTSRKNEALAFLRQSLQDISISRSNERAKNWGVPVPGDENQRMHVWFDALNIYQSGVGFGLDEEKYDKWWPADVHLIGKGIIRFHAVYWPAFLLSAGLRLPKNLFVHGYITVDGQKMSKTVGNVIDPFELVEKYGADAVRYYLLREIPSTRDGDFTIEKFEERYAADLAKGLGNFTARIIGLGAKHISKEFVGRAGQETSGKIEETGIRYKEAIENFRLDEALSAVWGLISHGDKFVDREKIWELPEKDGERFFPDISELCVILASVAKMLEPFLPKTAEKIFEQLGATSSDKKWKFKFNKGEALFPRL